jgi:KRAB domain-containing zinc finger protein
LLFDHLKMHMMIHTALRCTHCNKTFPTLSELQRHKLAHTYEQLFGCTQCEKDFSKERDLKEHELSHKKEKVFVCIQCDISFVTSVDLLAHASHLDSVYSS